MPLRYFEDFVPGVEVEVGTVTVSEEEIVEFARKYDPQPFHVDAEAARRSPFGGIIASGWQTAAFAHRLLTRAFAPDAVTYGSPGVDELRFRMPVRPGDTLTLQLAPLEARASTSKPDRGVIRLQLSLVNQHKQVVLSMIGLTIFGRRPQHP